MIDNLKRLMAERDEKLRERGSYGGGGLYLAALAVLPALIAVAEAGLAVKGHAHGCEALYSDRLEDTVCACGRNALRAALARLEEAR